MASCLGVLVVLMPVQTVFGLIAFGGAYLVTRHFDASAGIGLGLIALLAFLGSLPVAWVAYAAVLFVSIGLKKWLDLPRRVALARTEQARERASRNETHPAE